MTTAFRVSRIAEADDGPPDGQRPTRTRRMARFLDASTLDIRSRPANPHEPMSTQQLSTSTSPCRTRARSRSFGRTSGPAVADARCELSTSELAPVNPALTADEAGYRQSDSGAAVIVVGDASTQVLAGSGARQLHVDDLAVMGEEPVALAALKEGAPRTSWSGSPSPRSDPPATSFPGRSGSSSASPQRRGQVAKPELREPVKQ